MLFSAHGLHLYARAPNLQIGPLTFLVAEPLRFAGPSHGRYVATVLMTAAGPVILALGGRIGVAPLRKGRFFAVGLAMLAVWPELAVRFAHLDDVMALFCSVAALVAVRRQSAVTAALLLAAAAASKPWAAAFVPILFALPAPRRLAAVLTWAAGVAIVWGPFLVADPEGLWSAARFRLGIDRASSLRILGVQATHMPAWVRPAQIVGGLAISALLVARGRWVGAMLGAIALRLLLDPRAQTYYTSGVAVASVVADLWLTECALPLFTLGALLFLYVVLPIGIGAHGLGMLRVVYCLAVLAILVSGRLGPNAVR